MTSPRPTDAPRIEYRCVDGVVVSGYVENGEWRQSDVSPDELTRMQDEANRLASDDALWAYSIAMGPKVVNLATSAPGTAPRRVRIRGALRSGRPRARRTSSASRGSPDGDSDLPRPSGRLDRLHEAESASRLSRGGLLARWMRERPE